MNITVLKLYIGLRWH